jgi:hypothetical protein
MDYYLHGDITPLVNLEMVSQQADHLQCRLELVAGLAYQLEVVTI